MRVLNKLFLESCEAITSSSNELILKIKANGELVKVSNIAITEVNGLQNALADFTSLTATDARYVRFDTSLQGLNSTQQANARGNINAIGGSIASGQIAFGTGAGVIGGDSGLVWNNSEGRLQIGGVVAGPQLSLTRDTLYSAEGNTNISIGSSFTSGSPRLLIGVDSTNDISYIQSMQRGVGFNKALVLQGMSGNVLIGSFIGGLPTNTLDVNGTTRIRTINNGVGDFLTRNSEGVITHRTAVQVLSDIGATSLTATDARYVRFDTSLQGLNTTQQGNARGNIGAIGGSIASGQVAFGTDNGVIGGGSKFTYDSVNTILDLNGVGVSPKITFRASSLTSSIAEIGRGELASLVIRQIGAFATEFWNSNTLRWSILSTGILQSNGAQTIRTSTGNLTLATGAGNGNIILSPNGTGNVLIGTTTELTGGGRLQVASATGNQLNVFNNNANSAGQVATIALNVGSAWGVQLRTRQGAGWLELCDSSGVIFQRWEGSDYFPSNGSVRLRGSANAILINTTTELSGGGALQVNGTGRFSDLSSGDFSIVGANFQGVLQRFTIGSGLSLSNGILTATGGETGGVVTWENIQNKPTIFPTNWANVADKPTTFAPSAHTHAIADITGLQTTLNTFITSDTANARYVRFDTSVQGLNTTQQSNARTNINAEPAFTKNTAFNKNFGTAAGTVAEGNDSRILNGQTAFGWGDYRQFGLGANSTSISDSDLENPALNNGFYRATTATNSFGNTAVILHNRYDSTRLTQIGFGGNNNIKVRSWIGSGTYTDWATLYHSGNLRSNADNDARYVRFDTSLQGLNTTQQGNARANIAAIGGSIAAGQVAFGTANGVIGGDSGLVWDNVNKRLGIGNSNPLSLLSVVGGNNGFISSRRLDNTVGSNYHLEFRRGTGSGTNAAIATFGNANNGVSALVVEVGGIIRTVFNSTGNVLIGTTTELSGGGALQVNGNITCNSPTTSNHAVTLGFLDTYSTNNPNITRNNRAFTGIYEGDSNGSFVAHNGTGGTSFFNIYPQSWVYLSARYQPSIGQVAKFKGLVRFANSVPDFVLVINDITDDNVTFGGVPAGTYDFDIEIMTRIMGGATIRVNLDVKIYPVNGSTVYKRTASYIRNIGVTWVGNNINFNIRARFSASDTTNRLTLYNALITENLYQNFNS